MKPIDLAIIGGGCAGLSLARDIALCGIGKNQVAVFEPRTAYENDRTWCFWSLENEVDDALISRRWNAWQFSKDGESVIQRSTKSPYCMVAGADFYADALAKIEDAEGVELHLGIQVKSIESSVGGFKITTATGEFLTKRIVDTRPPVTPIAQIYQAFEGVEIETTHAISDPEIAGLMTQMQSDDNGFGFDYILPLGSNQWLVEATVFSRDSSCGDGLSGKLQASLDRIIPGGDFRCLRREKGMIPMGYRLPEAAHDPNWVRAGTAGGAVRAASGYAYRRIQRWSLECAKGFTESGEVIGHPADSWAQRKMDSLFLKVLRNESELAPELFHRMACGISADAMARFMMDRASALDLLAVISAVPKMPFLRNLPKHGDAAKKLV
jgi:lycopene beta-cyclase